MSRQPLLGHGNDLGRNAPEKRADFHCNDRDGINCNKRGTGLCHLASVPPEPESIPRNLGSRSCGSPAPQSFSVNL